MMLSWPRVLVQGLIVEETQKGEVIVGWGLGEMHVFRIKRPSKVTTVDTTIECR